MIKGVIFDFDGVIVDSEYISYECYRDFLKTYNIIFTKEDYIKYCPGKQLITTMNFFKEFYNLDINIDEACQYFRNREQYYLDKDGVPLKKGVKELLDYLVSKKIAICLATSSVEKRAITILDNYQLTKYFDAFVFGDEVKRGKPFPDVFLKACKKINVQKNEAIVIEDSEAGIEAGYNAKIRVICIPDMKYPDDKYQLMTCNIYRDLTNIIKYIETVG